MSGHSHFDESVEEYLESIYRLEYEGPGVTTSGLASAMGVTPASASGMLKKLDKEGYVSYVARGEVKLTRKGLEVGVRILRRHGTRVRRCESAAVAAHRIIRRSRCDRSFCGVVRSYGEGATFVALLKLPNKFHARSSTPSR